MRNDYEIIIEEISRKIVKVKASNKEEALCIVKAQYDNEEIVLDYSDLSETNFI